jgi:hypothetical protein
VPPFVLWLVVDIVRCLCFERLAAEACLVCVGEVTLGGAGTGEVTLDGSWTGDVIPDGACAGEVTLCGGGAKGGGLLATSFRPRDGVEPAPVEAVLGRRGSLVGGSSYIDDGAEDRGDRARPLRSYVPLETEERSSSRPLLAPYAGADAESTRAG